MKAVEIVPPPLLKPVAARSGRRALQSLVLLFCLMGAARVAFDLQLPIPACPLREMTGVPCPFCGSTRTFAALATFDLAAAIRFNPLVCVGACFAGALWLLTAVRAEKLVERLSRLPAGGAVWKWGFALTLVSNWLYLWLYLPR